MMFEMLCNNYGLGTLYSASPMTPGTEAAVWTLNTERGSFLLRTLTDRAQGEHEWAVVCHLRAKGFGCCPAILTTGDDMPCILLEGTWYQVQELCSGTMPDPSAPGTAAAMARTLRELERCMPDGLIHGDLGPWNMVQKEDGSLFVIDFGCTRAGDPYFDYAAALGGVINHVPPETRPHVCGEFLRELDADRNHLLSQLRLWAEEGITRWSKQSPKMTARFQQALMWAEENIYDV